MKNFIFSIALLLSALPSGALGDAMSEQQMERIKRVFTELRADNLQILDDFYDPETHFEDPLGAHRGLSTVKKYYGGLYQNVQSIRFDYLDTISEPNKHLLVWKMTLQAKNLNKGEPVVVFGNSVIKFNESNLVSYHRDYFDMGEFIYEHVPILGWLVKKAKARLKE